MYYLFLLWAYLFFCAAFVFGLSEVFSLYADVFGIFLVLIALGIVGSIAISLALYFSDKE